MAILLVRELSGQGRHCFVMALNQEFAHEENRRAVLSLASITLRIGQSSLGLLAHTDPYR